MTKSEKIQVVQELTDKFKESPNFYIADTGGLSVAEVNELRKLCFDAGVTMKVFKNTLIRKALENSEGDYEELFPTLKLHSAVFFPSETLNGPAKIIKDFRGKKEIPSLKAAYIDKSIFLGDGNLAALVALKSKEELIGEIISLLQSPAKNVISALQSGGQKLSGILKTLSEKKES